MNKRHLTLFIAFLLIVALYTAASVFTESSRFTRNCSAEQAANNCETTVNAEITVCGKAVTQQINVPLHVALTAQQKGGYKALAQDMLMRRVMPEKVLDYFCHGLGGAFFAELALREIPPKNATVTTCDKPPYFSYTKGENGLLFDKSIAVVHLASAMDGNKTAITLSPAKPAVSLSDLKKQTALCSEYSTRFHGSSEGRKSNIARALMLINGTVLNCGEEFSFNTAVGERTVERGFKKAKIISDGEYIQGVGGGVCQAATTLYNAALRAGLCISTVSRHTYCASYVPPSLDAMVSSVSDLRFVNSGDKPVYIFTLVKENTATVKIYGEYQKQYDIKTEIISETPFRNVDEKGRELQSTQGFILVSQGHCGITSQAVWITPNGNKQIRKDTYKCKDAVWRPADE